MALPKTLSKAEEDEVWKVIEKSPLVTKWPWFRQQMLPWLNIVPYEAGSTVFQRGDPPLYFYVVIEGAVVQRLIGPGQSWFEMTFKPGQFFGQHALFTGQYDSIASVTQDGRARLLRMTAADLRKAMEHNADLYEELLHEKRAARLRRMPLLRSLNDAQVRRLTEAIEERDFAAGDKMPVSEQAGIWMIEWGQVTVTGPSSLNPRDPWRLTAGNFFVDMGGSAPQGGPSQESAPQGSTPQGGSSPLRVQGRNTSVTGATAHLASHLFFLPAAHADRLVAAFSDVASLLRTPLPLPDVLASVDRFKDLSAERRQHLAQFCGWEFVPERQNITTQGHIGNHYVILREGGALVTALDDSGRERPKNRLRAVHGYGATSLLEGRPRDATVRAVQGPFLDGRPGVLKGADIVTLDRRDMRFAFQERRDLWPSDVELVKNTVQTQEDKVPYDWMQEGEVLKWQGRAHAFWLIGPILPVVISVILLVLFGIFGANLLTGAALAAGILIGVIVLPLAIWIAYNYFDDYYAVTNRRVTRRDHQVLLYQSRVEAPVETIQDVTAQTSFWGRVFDFGDLTIRTAAKVGAIKFLHVPQPDRVKEAIEEQRTETLAAARGLQKEQLRQGLMTGLQLALPVPERGRALGNAPQPKPTGPFSWLRKPAPKTGTALPTKPKMSNLFRHITPERWHKVLFGPPPPPPKPVSGETLWRKHWFNLVQRIGLPLLSLLALIVVGVLIVRAETSTPLGISPVGLTLGWLVLTLSALGWFFWNYVDYRNDVYVLTDDRIMDIEMKPFGLFAKRREGSLERVQNVVYTQNGLMANIFNYGDVVISTAAQDEGYTFLMVPNPKLVQATVFAKLDAFRARQEQKRATDRQRELIEGLEVYHRLLGQGGLPRSWDEEA